MWEDVRLWKIVQVGGMVWYHQQHGSGNAKMVLLVAKLWASLFLFALASASLEHAWNGFGRH